MKLFKRTHNPFEIEGEKTLHKNLEFTALEQYKLLRANLEFTIPAGTKCPVIGVTSSVRGEGKSVTSINLSFVLAETGSKVLLIDGDLRLPTVAKKMGLESTPGVSNMLIDQCAKSLEEFKSDILDTWYILPSGDIPPNPSELLGSARMGALLDSLREHFDYIVIDLPPVNIVSDALSVSDMTTGMLVVVREKYTEKKELRRCYRQLKMANANVLGCVLSGVDSAGTKYYKYRKYRYYKYYKYSDYL